LCPDPTDPGTTLVPPDSPADSGDPPGSDPDSSQPDSSYPDGTGPEDHDPYGSGPDSATTAAPGEDTSVTPTSAPATDPTQPSTAPAPPTSSTTVPAPNLAEPQLPEPPPAGWPVRQITFPVAGPVTYFDDWGACRGGTGCPRRHIGNDVIGMRLQPLLAAADGTVTHLVLDHVTAGWGLVITDAEGWDYRYYHVNNDAPGTDDGTDPVQWRWAPGIAEGSVVRAGQVVAYVGDSGNSETSVPHLHFEIHQPDGRAINPYVSLRAAEAAQRCRPDGDGSEETLLPVPPPANAVVEVRTRTGRGAFHLGPDGTTWLTGDALTVGWDRHAADDPACPATGQPAGATAPTAFATPWVTPSTAPPASVAPSAAPAPTAPPTSAPSSAPPTSG
jgi:hypothetical protein